MTLLRVVTLVPATVDALEAYVEGLVRLNQWQFAAAEGGDVGVPALYESGVVYRRERGSENWQSAAELIQSGSGDCEDLAAYRAAELREFEDDWARVAIIRTPRGSFHAVVEHEDGTIEDPSAILVHSERKAS